MNLVFNIVSYDATIAVACSQRYRFAVRAVVLKFSNIPMGIALDASPRPNHRQKLRPTLRQPHLPRPSQDLPHRGIGARQGDGLKLLAAWVKTQHRVVAPLRGPDDVLVVDVDRIHMRVGAWGFIRFPAVGACAQCRVVHGEVAAVPFRNPDAAFAVWLHSFCTLVRRQWFDDAAHRRTVLPVRAWHGML